LIIILTIFFKANSELEDVKMGWSLVRGIILLPGMVLGVFPYIISWLTRNTRFAASATPPSKAVFWLAIFISVFAFALIIRTVTLFFKIGIGTPAPWDPPKRLVVQGPYRYVRNPMITAVLLVLLAESLFFQSWPIVVWMLLFFVLNSIYFPLVEEKRLRRRFGEDYNIYCKNVPRWIPRLKPWQPENEKQPQ
jgi:protein-S-isoprenylcysteine O-methyltransferase Ste14